MHVSRPPPAPFFEDSSTFFLFCNLSFVKYFQRCLDNEAHSRFVITGGVYHSKQENKKASSPFSVILWYTEITKYMV